MLGNWIKQSTTGTGTGNLSLSAVTGHPTFADEFTGSTRFAYTITDADGLPIERGVGYLSGGALVRERVRATYASGVYTGANAAAVSLPTGTKYVICSPGDTTLLGAAPGMWAGSFRGYGDLNVVTSGSTPTLTANRVYLLPFAATVDADIDAVMFRVGTAGAASTQAKVCVFSMGIDGLPGAALADSTIAVDSTGNKQATFSRIRPPARFFVGILSNGTPAIEGSGNGLLNCFSMGLGVALNPSPMLTQDGATGLTFPTSWAPTWQSSNVARPSLFVRVP